MAVRTVVYRIRADVQGARTQVAAFGASLKKAADDATAATKEGAKFRQGLDTIGNAAGKVGLAAAAGLGAAVLKAASFDAAMSQVQAATRESAKSMETLRQAALDAGASTVFSATEAADGIEQLAKAGVETGDILNGGLLGALDLAAAGTIEVAEASEIAATTMNQFGLAGSEVGHIADVLAASAGKAQGEVTDMANALKFVGPVASQMGISLEETAGSIAYLASQGILGEQAGTSLRGMLTGLTSPSKIAAGEMKALGINMYDAQGQFVGLDGLAGQLQGTLSGLGEAERDAALGRLFGNEQITAARILYKGGSQAIEEWTAKVNDQGFAADTAAMKLDNLKGDLEALGGAFETALIGTGDGAQTPLRGLTQALTDAVNAYNDLGEGAKTGVAVTLGATALLGGGLFVFAKMVQSIASTRLALTQLGITATGTKGSLVALGKTGGSILLVAGAVSALGNALAKANGAVLDADDLQRNIEALSLGNGDQTLDRLVDDLDIANQLSGDLTEPLKEVFTLFGAIGNTNLDNAKDNLSQIDGALAGLVESGNGDKAAEVFERIMKASDLDDAEVNEYFDSYLLALENTDAAGKDVATTIGGVGTETAKLGNTSYRTAEQLEDEAKALEEARDAARGTAQSFINLTAATEGQKATLGGWIKELEDQADALANFRINAEKAGQKGVREGLIAELENLGPEGAKQLRWLANATDKEIARANRAWIRAQREIEKTTDAILGVPAPKPIKVTVLKDAAIADLYRLREFKIGDKTIRIKTVRLGNGEVDYLGGRGYAAGGYTGAGGKYEPAGLVHRGEYVFDAKATKGNEAYLASLHSTLRGYAGGGLVGGMSAPASTIAPIDYDRLTDAMLRARPLHGPVHINGDPTEYKRQMRRDEQAANLGGRPRS